MKNRNVEIKTWNVSCVRSGYTTVKARTEEEAWQEANKLKVTDVYWDDDDWTPTSVNVVNKR